MPRPVGLARGPQVVPAVPLLPTTPFQPINPGPGFCNLPASDSGSASQSMLMLRLAGKLGTLTPEMISPTIADCSAKPGARKDVPQSPLTITPASFESVQLKPILGLLVPPKSLYWSWRHDASISSCW